jgi:multidrug resistance efflux pump
LPKPSGWSRNRKALVAGGSGILVLVAMVVAYIMIQHPFHQARADLVTHKVRYDRLELTIVERGTLESAKNSDIYCRVKAGAKNTTVSTTIKTVIDDGSEVLKDRPPEQARTIFVWDDQNAAYVEKPGNPTGFARVVEVPDKEAGRTYYSDLLVELDDSGLQEQLKDQKIVVDKAESDWIQAQQLYTIQEEKYKSDKKTAETNLELAKIDLEKYQKGDFPQALKDVEGRIKVAESDLEQQRDRAAWAQRMLKKGYYTVSQADSEQSKLQSLELALAKVIEEKRVLVEPAFGLKKRTETDFKNKVDVAALALGQVQRQWVATEVQYRTDRDTKKSIYDQGVSKYKDIKEEIKKCKLYALQDGMVVYFTPEQARFGGGSQQSIVAQGEPVREGQKLMQIPDLAHMLVNTKVHEALVSHVHKDQPATIRIDSFPDRRLTGHVDFVSTISSQLDFWSADVKVYITKVAIDEGLDGLKPGMSAEVTITIGDVLDHVLTVPIQAVVGSAELGKKRKCFVVTPDGPVERDIVVGMSNDKMVEIREGLQEGDEVVLNPKVLVGDKAKTRQPGQEKREGEGSDKGSGDKPRRPGGKPGPGAAPGNGSGGAPDKYGPRGNGTGEPPAARREAPDQGDPEHRGNAKDMSRAKGK